MVPGFLIAVASLVAEHSLHLVAALGLWSMWAQLWCMGLVALRLVESSPDQGSNLCLLPWQVGSYPLPHQRSPESIIDS